jgi:hypothetical protein
MVDLTDKGGIGGLDIAVKATITSTGIGIQPTTSTKSITVHVSHDYIGEYAVWTFIALLVIFVVGWVTGIWEKVTKGKHLKRPRFGGGGGEEDLGDDE